MGEEGRGDIHRDRWGRDMARPLTVACDQNATVARKLAFKFKVVLFSFCYCYVFFLPSLFTVGQRCYPSLCE